MKEHLNNKEIGEPCEGCQCADNPSGFCVGCVNKWLYEAEELGRIKEGVYLIEQMIEKNNEILHTTRKTLAWDKPSY